MLNVGFLNYFASVFNTPTLTNSTQKTMAAGPVSSIDMIYKLDADGRYTYLNEVAARILRKRPQEIYGKSFLSFVREDHREKILSFYQEQLERHLPSTYFEFPLIPIRGKQIWIGQTVDFVFEQGELKEVVAVAHDISEKVFAQQLAVSNEEKYRNIIENINLGLMEVDLDENIVFANESFCRMMGYSLDELLGKNASEVFLEVDDNENKEKISGANVSRAEGQFSAYEVKIKKKDGTPVWMIISGAPVKNSSGEVIGSLGIHNDITERKRQEIQRQELLEELESRNEELHQKQTYLKAINDLAAGLIRSRGVQEIVREITHNIISRFELTDCVVYLMNEEGTALNQVSAFGSKDKEGDLLNPIKIGLGDGIVGSVAASATAEIVNDTSNDPRYIEDMERNLSELAVPIIADGEVIGVIDSEHPEANFYTESHLNAFTTVSNMAATRIKSAIIRQKRDEAEMALKDSETKLRSVINSSLDAIITINEKGIITEWNNQAIELFGFKRNESIGKDLGTLIIPEKFREAHARGMKHFLQTGEGPVLNQRIEISAMHKEGHYFPVELSIVPVRMNKSYLFSAFVRDITLRKKAEHDMEQALEKQKELSGLKSRLISMTSHEFRTPLTTIQSNTDLISFMIEREGIPNKEKLNKNFERINFEIARLNNMVNDILMAGKLESGQMSFKPMLTDVVHLCHEVVSQSFAYQRDGRQVHVSVYGKPVPILIDKQIYSHIITNLLSNAFKYSEDRPNPKLDLIFEDDQMQLIVQDFGIGIPAEDMSNLFDSFYRAGNAGSVKGNGMGLAIVKQFVEFHGATIEVESEIGLGTTFTITHYHENANSQTHENSQYSHR